MAFIPLAHPHRTSLPCDRLCLARRIATAIGGFEHRFLGRIPRSVTVIGSGGLTIVTVQTGLSEMERHVAATVAGRRRVLAWHRSLVAGSFDALRDHLHAAAGVWMQAAATQVDFTTGQVIKTCSTAAAIDVVVLGGGIPGLGVAADDHVHADRTDGLGPVRYESHPEGPQTMKKVPHVGVDQEESRERGDRSA